MPQSIADFRRTNPAALRWARRHAARLVTEVSSTTRTRIRAIVASAFEEGRDVRSIARDIHGLLDDRKRALMIARTETMAAANAGQRLLWEQAVEDGLLTGDEEQRWVTADDEKTCPVCGALDDERVPLGETFETGDDELDGPPAHPNCRCTVVLVPARARRRQRARAAVGRFAAGFSDDQPRDKHGRWTDDGSVSEDFAQQTGVFEFNAQADQYPTTGQPGIGYFKGEIDDAHHVDALLYRDDKGKVVGILNHYPMDILPYERAGNVNVMVRPDQQRKGIGLKLLREADKRWKINFQQQSYSRAGKALVTRYQKMRTAAFNPDQPRDWHGRWVDEGGAVEKEHDRVLKKWDKEDRREGERSLLQDWDVKTVPEYKQKAGAALERMVENSNVFVRMNVGDLNAVLASGEIMNAFQTGRSHGGTDHTGKYWARDRREHVEEKVFGVPKGADGAERPKYGYLASGDGLTEMPRGVLQGAGNVAVQLKDHVKDRTTFTIGDSLDQSVTIMPEGLGGGFLDNGRNFIPQPVRSPNLLAAPDGEIPGRIYDWRTDKAHRPTRIEELSDSYVEAQIHRRLRLSDIERVVFGGKKPGAAVLNRLKKAGIKVKVAPRWERVKRYAAGFNPELPELRDAEFDPNQPRDDHGKWTSEGGTSTADVESTVFHGTLLDHLDSILKNGIYAQRNTKERTTGGIPWRGKLAYVTKDFNEAQTFTHSSEPVYGRTPKHGVVLEIRVPPGEKFIQSSMKDSILAREQDIPASWIKGVWARVLPNGQFRPFVTPAQARAQRARGIKPTPTSWKKIRSLAARLGETFYAVVFLDDGSFSDAALWAQIFDEDLRAAEYDPNQPRDERGKWTREGGGRLDNDYEGYHPNDVQQYLRGEKRTGDRFFQSSPYRNWVKREERASKIELKKVRDEKSRLIKRDRELKREYDRAWRENKPMRSIEAEQNRVWREIDRVEDKLDALRWGGDIGGVSVTTKAVLDDWTADSDTSARTQAKIREIWEDAPKFKGIVYRGDDSGRFERLKEGSVFKLKHFVSGSRDPRVASGFADTALLRIKLKSGLAIEQFAKEHKGEREVVLPPGRYKVTRAYRGNEDRVKILEMRQL